MNGREVLARIKADENLKSIPTLILTTSDAQADIATSYKLQANCYLSKPVELDAFENLVKSINEFWLTRAKLSHQRECYGRMTDKDTSSRERTSHSDRVRSITVTPLPA
jgi:response regulator RpfG family c-di-GMP phosphodiesterase